MVAIGHYLDLFVNFSALKNESITLTDLLDVFDYPDLTIKFIFDKFLQIFEDRTLVIFPKGNWNTFDVEHIFRIIFHIFFSTVFVIFMTIYRPRFNSMLL